MTFLYIWKTCQMDPDQLEWRS